MIDVYRWRAKRAAAACFQEAIVVPTPARFAERGQGRSRRYVEENAAREVLLIDADSIMVEPMNPVGHGCVEHARRSR